MINNWMWWLLFSKDSLSLCRNIWAWAYPSKWFLSFSKPSTKAKSPSEGFLESLPWCRSQLMHLPGQPAAQPCKLPWHFGLWYSMVRIHLHLLMMKILISTELQKFHVLPFWTHLFVYRLFLPQVVSWGRSWLRPILFPLDFITIHPLPSSQCFNTKIWY